MKINDIIVDGEELKSIKNSFFHIYHSFLDEGYLSKDFVSCLMKWAVQLQIGSDELKYLDPGTNEAPIPSREAALEHLFNLVYMIYLDGIVEDIELEVVSKYAEKIGFQTHIVNDLLKTIVTAPYDGFDFNFVKKDLKELLEYSEN